MNSHPVLLKSAGVGKVLIWLLGISLGLSILKLIDKAIPAIALKQLLHIFAIPSILVNLAILLLSLVWIYRLHDDLNRCYDRYPIDSWNALWSVVFCIFIWKTLMTIAHHFQRETGRLRRYGLQLSRLVPVTYGIFIAVYLLQLLIYEPADVMGRMEIRNLPESLLQVAIAFKDILGVAGAIVLLAIAQIIVNAMDLKFEKIMQR
ncbi:MAG: hypothetical protein KME23_05930 [Goleter apudmare HA4340-LM2]|jgi:hypothetical protein|nr:hypothetical protein [Goleter apudmare HA4340-LM2]